MVKMEGKHAGELQIIQKLSWNQTFNHNCTKLVEFKIFFAFSPTQDEKIYSIVTANCFSSRTLLSMSGENLVYFLDAGSNIQSNNEVITKEKEISIG